MADSDIPAEAVEEVRLWFRCRCDPAWTDRNMHAPDCLLEYAEDVLDLLGETLTKARADERARVLAEVEEALRDPRRFQKWQQAGIHGYVTPPGRRTLATCDALGEDVGSLSVSEERWAALGRGGGRNR
jgi:hypothetical protein